MVSIGKKSNLLNLFSGMSNERPAEAQLDGSSEQNSSNTSHLKGHSDRLVDPYLLRRYGKYLILLAIENQKDGSVIL